MLCFEFPPTAFMTFSGNEFMFLLAPSSSLVKMCTIMYRHAATLQEHCKARTQKTWELEKEVSNSLSSLIFEFRI